MRTPRFEIFEGKNNEFFFRLKAKNGKIIIQSEGYTRKENCKDAVELIIEISPKLLHGEWVQKSPNRGLCGLKGPSPLTGFYWFHIKARNGEIIAHSETYSKKRGAINGLRSVQRCAPIAEIVDLTIKTN